MINYKAFFSSPSSPHYRIRAH